MTNSSVCSVTAKVIKQHFAGHSGSPQVALLCDSLGYCVFTADQISRVRRKTMEEDSTDFGAGVL